MKNLLLILILSFLSIAASAQDSISFNMHYLPMHKYIQDASTEMKLTTTFSGSDSMLQALKDGGVSNPTTRERSLIIQGTSTTGAIDKNRVTPITTMFEIKDGKGNVVIPRGAGLAGTVREDEMPEYDSTILPDGSDSTIKKVLLQTKNMLQQVTLPNKKMVVGDHYVQTTPMTIPVSGTVMKMNISIDYILKAVTDSIASFDLVMTADFNAYFGTKNAKGSGSGGGTLNYDRVNHFPSTDKLDFDLHLSLPNKDLSINIDVTEHSYHHYKILPL